MSLKTKIFFFDSESSRTLERRDERTLCVRKFVLSHQDDDMEDWRKNDPFSILYICESPKNQQKNFPQ